MKTIPLSNDRWAEVECYEGESGYYLDVYCPTVGPIHKAGPFEEELAAVEALDKWLTQENVK